MNFFQSADALNSNNAAAESQNLPINSEGDAYRPPDFLTCEINHNSPKPIITLEHPIPENNLTSSSEPTLVEHQPMSESNLFVPKKTSSIGLRFGRRIFTPIVEETDEDPSPSSGPTSSIAIHKSARIRTLDASTSESSSDSDSDIEIENDVESSTTNIISSDAKEPSVLQGFVNAIKWWNPSTAILNSAIGLANGLVNTGLKFVAQTFG